MKNVHKGGKVTYTRAEAIAGGAEQDSRTAQAAIGFDAKRGEAISVQDMSFDADAAESDLPAANWATQVQKTVAGLLVPPAAGFASGALYAGIHVYAPADAETRVEPERPRLRYATGIGDNEAGTLFPSGSIGDCE